MSDTATLAKPVSSTEEFVERLDSLAERSEPTIFNMRARLPTQGRADMPLAATEKMTVVLKAYASGGENAVHAHPNEDHTFVVLQGSATFFDKDGEIGTLERHQGIMLPRGAFYMFQAGEDEQLVMLRVGTVIAAGLDPNDRIDTTGHYMDGFSEDNKEVELLFESDAIFE